MSDRVTLPTEFFDRTSEVILRQPEPQYLYAQLVFMADAAAELQRLSAMGITPERAIPDTAAAVPQFQFFQAILSGNLPVSEAIMVSNELAPGKVGHTIRMNRPVFAGGGYTSAARRIAAQQSISTQAIGLTAEQVSITIQRNGGPYDTVNSRVAPLPVDRMDSAHAVHSMASTIGLQLYRDRIKFVDSVYASLFDSGSSVLYPADPRGALTSAGTTGDATAFPSTVAGTRPMDFEALMRMQTALATANISRFANGRYVCVLTPQQAQDLSLDPLFARQTTLTPSLNAVDPLSASLVKSISGIDVYQSNTNTIDTTTVPGLSIHHGTMFGPSSIGRAPAGPCRAAYSSDDNYGETAKVIWLAYEGEALLDNRFIVNIHTN